MKLIYDDTKEPWEMLKLFDNQGELTHTISSFQMKLVPIDLENGEELQEISITRWGNTLADRQAYAQNFSRAYLEDRKSKPEKKDYIARQIQFPLDSGMPLLDFLLWKEDDMLVCKCLTFGHFSYSEKPSLNEAIADCLCKSLDSTIGAIHSLNAKGLLDSLFANGVTSEDELGIFRSLMLEEDVERMLKTANWTIQEGTQGKHIVCDSFPELFKAGVDEYSDWLNNFYETHKGV